MNVTNKPYPNKSISHDALLNGITKRIANKSDQAHSLVHEHLIGSMAVGFIPIPMLDSAVLMGIHLKMLNNLCNLYGYKFSKTWGKSVIASLLGFFGTKAAFVPLAVSIAKIIPGIGTVSAIASMSILGASSTYAIGKVFIQHFESGGTFLNFNPDEKEIHTRFKRYFDEGREIASKMK